MRLIALFAWFLVAVGCNMYTELDRPGELEADAGRDVENGADAGDVGEIFDASPDIGAEDMGGADGCLPETDEELCRVAGADCDTVAITDNCGVSRSIECGVCESAACGEIEPNVCGCPCNIGGMCYADGAYNPDESCEYCDAVANPTAWTVSDPNCGRDFPIGEEVRADLGSISANGWEQLQDGETTPELETVDGNPTSVMISAADFVGDQTGGALTNTLGIPVEVTRDTLWVGSFDGHEAALGLRAVVRVEGLPTGEYRVRLFASRTEDDGGIGRLTRYQIGAETIDYDPVDNTSNVAVFESVQAESAIEIGVVVSPAGTGRFAYLGAVTIERVQ